MSPMRHKACRLGHGSGARSSHASRHRPTPALADPRPIRHSRRDGVTVPSGVCRSSGPRDVVAHSMCRFAEALIPLHDRDGTESRGRAAWWPRASGSGQRKVPVAWMRRPLGRAGRAPGTPGTASPATRAAPLRSPHRRAACRPLPPGPSPVRTGARTVGGPSRARGRVQPGRSCRLRRPSSGYGGLLPAPASRTRPMADSPWAGGSWRTRLNTPPHPCVPTAIQAPRTAVARQHTDSGPPGGREV